MRWNPNIVSFGFPENATATAYMIFQVAQLKVELFVAGLIAHSLSVIRLCLLTWVHVKL
jgi:hypothetical protein